MACSILTRCLRQGLLRSGDTVAPFSAAQHLHTTNTVQGSLNMPERLQNIPQAAVSFLFLVLAKIVNKRNKVDYYLLQDPGFFEMVEYFFHKATILAEDNLIDEEMRTMRATREEKVKKAHGKIKYLDYYKPFHPGNRDLGFFVALGYNLPYSRLLSRTHSLV